VSPAILVCCIQWAPGMALRSLAPHKGNRRTPI
jgi:hypothetical protein